MTLVPLIFSGTMQASARQQPDRWRYRARSGMADSNVGIAVRCSNL